MSSHDSKIKLRYPNNPIKITIAQTTSRLLKDRFPQIFKELHPTLNREIELNKITYGSKKMLWWNCPNNKCGHHIYQATVGNRTSLGRACPYCGHRRCCECNSLWGLYPQIAKQLSPKNNIDPKVLPPYSHKKLIWNCSKCDYEYLAYVYDRTGGTNCPYCVNQKVARERSFAAKYPELLKEFSHKNQIDPFTLAPGTDKRYTWKCSKCNFEWEAQLSNRTSGHTSCPRCNFSRLD